MELECERLRREEVESQADQLRKQLQQQTENFELSQKMLQTVRCYVHTVTVQWKLCQLRDTSQHTPKDYKWRTIVIHLKLNNLGIMQIVNAKLPL